MERLAPLIAQVRRVNRLTFGFGLVAATFGGFLYIIPAKTGSDLAIKIGIMGFFVAMGVVFVVMGLRAPEKHAGIRALLERPHEIVWVYIVRRMRGTNQVGSTLRLAMIDGKMLILPLQMGTETAMESLAATFATQAHVGYDPKLDSQFKRDPASLRS